MASLLRQRPNGSSILVGKKESYGISEASARSTIIGHNNEKECGAVRDRTHHSRQICRGRTSLQRLKESLPKFRKEKKHRAVSSPTKLEAVHNKRGHAGIPFLFRKQGPPDLDTSSLDHGESQSESAPSVIDVSIQKPLGDNVDLDASFRSENSLLDALTDDEASISSNCRGLERILKRFQVRDKTLKRISGGRSLSYQQSLLENEHAARHMTLQLYRESTGCPDAKDKIETMETPEQPTVGVRVRKEFLFEYYHTPEAMWGFLCYCVCHSSFFATMDNILQGTQRWSKIPPNAFYALLILVCLICMRANGYLWQWLGKKSYRLVKFDLHNRDMLRTWDARIMRFFQHPRWKACNLLLKFILFYAAYVGVSYYYYMLLHEYEKVILKWYNKIEGEMYQAILESGEQYDEHFCTLVPAMVSPWYRKVIVYDICKDQWTVASGIFHVTFFFMATIAMSMVGVAVFE